ncbi:hypothetical protein [Nitrospira moscoviensis]|uniref:Uncharacterized protein n=1 Tax=Nitrospira moscoviensis TaxID=42253 RepID=A0A0K2GJM0_NITMO|nr:hypothetical protein [Nitrospira moscoviensis]ALA61150.1 exported protein of unknown function [Nitrospira moscoviensis]
MRSVAAALLVMPVLGWALGFSQAEAALVTPSDIQVTHLELTGGSVDIGGRLSRKLARLFEQPGLLLLNEYQPGPDIVDPIVRGRRTFSLFTSGVQGNAPPTAIISGDTITVDLSSLFFGVSRGDRLRAWNIGGVATGTFNPDTLEFCLTWDHLFGNRRLGTATFSLQGIALTTPTAPVPLITTFVLFATGLAMVLGIRRRSVDVRQDAPP